MAIKELIPPSAYSAAAAAKEHHALIKSPARLVMTKIVRALAS